MAAPKPHHTVHDHIGPAVRPEPATYFTIHGTRAEVARTLTALLKLGEVIVTQEPTACTELGNTGTCVWLEIVLSGQISLAEFFTAYQAALAANN